MSDHDTSTNGGADMVVEVTDEGPCRKRLRTEIPASQVEQEVATSYHQLRSNIQLPGFRKGKVPRSVLERKFGEQVENEVREDLMHKSFEEGLEKHELRLIGSPKFDKVEFKVGEPFTFEAVFDVVPNFELPKYKGLEMHAEPTDVSDSEVDAEIEHLRERVAELEEIESPKEGDFCRSKISLRVGEESIDRDDVHLKIGLDRVDNIEVEGMGEKLAAAKVGDELSFEVDVPEDFMEESFRGQKATLTVEVKAFQTRRLPELDEEFAGRFNQESLEQLRSEVRKSLENGRRSEEESRQERALVDQLCEATDMELPESILESRKRELANNLRYQLAQQGMAEEEIAATVEADKNLVERARRDLVEIFVLEKIAEEEVILVTEDDIIRRITEISMATGREASEVFEDYRRHGLLSELRAGMSREKVRAFLRKKAKIVGGDSPSVEKKDEAPASGSSASEEAD
ncbi:MAG: trigger factor [Planctomycetes bacterium]|nr:trigger factor [Planctomycetota bacterium]